MCQPRERGRTKILMESKRWRNTMPLDQMNSADCACLAIELKGKGGLDQLQENELPLMAPKKGQIRIQ